MYSGYGLGVEGESLNSLEHCIKYLSLKEGVLIAL